MKTHLISIGYQGRRFAKFFQFPANERPKVTQKMISEILGFEPIRGATISIGI